MPLVAICPRATIGRMWKWVTGCFAVLLLALGCLTAMGAGYKPVGYLLVALFLMTLTAGLIARPFLKQRPPPGS